MLGPEKWNFLYLYVVIDIWSRYVVGWMLARAERAKLAEALLGGSIANQGVCPRQLTVHADRGTSMASKPVAFLLADLGVTMTHNRPHCSKDNPYSEAHFRTLKYRPSFPARFGSFEDAHIFADVSSVGATRTAATAGSRSRPRRFHYGRAELLQTQRAVVLQAAYAAHPERFVRKPPTRPAMPTGAWINQPGQHLAERYELPTISGRSWPPTWLELMAMPPRSHKAGAYVSTILWSAIVLAPRRRGSLGAT